MVKGRSAFGKNNRLEIAHTLGRYLAILAIVALGVGFFSGVKVSRSAMVETGDRYVQAHHLFDFRLLSTLGLTRQDVDAFAAMEGIAQAQGAVTADMIADVGDNTGVVLAAQSLTPGINDPELVCGRMPENGGECLLDARYFDESVIGRQVVLSDENPQDTRDWFAYDAYTVVGLCNSVLYLNVERGASALANGTVYGFAFMPLDGFDSEVFTTVYLTAASGGAQIFSDAYDRAVDPLEQPLTELMQQRAELRREDLIDQANREIRDAQREWDDGQAQYEQGLKEYQENYDQASRELEDAWTTLQDARVELEDARALLDENRQTLLDGWAEYEQGLADYQDGVAQLGQGRQEADEQLGGAYAQLDAGQAQLDAGREQLETIQKLLDVLEDLGIPPALWEGLLDDAYAELEAGQAQLDEAEGQLADASIETGTQLREAEEQLLDAGNQLRAARAELQEGQAQWDEGWAQYQQGLSRYQQGLSDYQQAKAEADAGFADARAELADAKALLDDGAAQLEDAREQAADIQAADVYVLGRDTNVGYACFNSDSAIVDGIAKVFPAFFFLVAALVCMTTMTRMVDEQRTQIGTFKALGYSDAAIAWKYMSYSGSAALIGAVAGFGLGTWLFPMAIWKAYGMLYGFADLVYVFDWVLAALSLAVALLCSVGATYLVCRAELRQMPAQLMRPKAPQAGKRVLLERVGFIWNRIGFLHKVSVRNIFRYKKRLAMMLLGIGGCTALMLTGMGLGDSIRTIADEQFDGIFLYDYEITFSSARSQSQQERFVRQSAQLLDQSVFVRADTLQVDAQGVMKTANIVATDDPALRDMVNLSLDGQPAAYPTDGKIAVSRKLAEFAGVEPGDLITLYLDDGSARQVEVGSVFDNYIYHYIYMTGATYESITGEPCACQTAYAVSSRADYHAVSAALMSDYGAASVISSQDLRGRVDSMMDSLNAIVYLVIACAAALALVVLYNLSNINITERVREIATIKVLGFYPGETGAYVMRENFVLTLMGALLGLPAGIGLLSYVMSQINIDMVAFRVQILPTSFICAPALTFGLTIVVDLLLRRKIERINMAESLKSVE